jgi:hypothetical protein
MDPKQVWAHSKYLLEQREGARPIEQHTRSGRVFLKCFRGIAYRDSYFAELAQHRKLRLSRFGQNENGVVFHLHTTNWAKDYTTFAAHRRSHARFREIKIRLCVFVFDTSKSILLNYTALQELWMIDRALSKFYGEWF